MALHGGGDTHHRAAFASSIFTSRDPFAGMAETPYSLHPYQYAYANPVRNTDPTGTYSSSPIEAMIQRHYESHYTIGKFQAEYPVYLSAKGHLELNPWGGKLEGDAPDFIEAGRLDIVDIYGEIGYAYEIKHQRDQLQGSLEIERYIRIYNGLPPPKSPHSIPTPPRRLVEGSNFPAERWDVIGPNPFPNLLFQTIIARLGEPGVIVWKAVNTNRVPIPILVEERDKANYKERRGWSALRPGYTSTFGWCFLLPGFPGFPGFSDPFSSDPFGKDPNKDNDDIFRGILRPPAPLVPTDRNAAYAKYA